MTNVQALPAAGFADDNGVITSPVTSDGVTLRILTSPPLSATSWVGIVGFRSSAPSSFSAPSLAAISVIGANAALSDVSVTWPLVSLATSAPVPALDEALTPALFEIEISVVRQQHWELDRLADQRGIGEHLGA